MIDIHIAKNKSEINKIFKIREEVFIKDQNVSKDREKDGLDDESW